MALAGFLQLLTPPPTPHPKQSIPPDLQAGSSSTHQNAAQCLRAPVLRLQRDSGQQVGQHRLLQSRSDHLPPFPPRVQAPVLHQDGKRGAGGPFDQWMRHLPSLPAAGVARDPDPLLQQRSLQWIPCLLLLPCLLPPDLVDGPAYLPPVKQSSETPGRLSGHAAAARWPQISFFVLLGPLAAIRRGGFIVILH
ncbi:uncharacterized protein LOC117671320 isoform X1 [Pantherophis guttatus]|uniref:Uncharacterized protein LOC117671320 isoform X1 n=1 Tax=Pantherophis guttatus TaxID=94885 RepID=A0A6P9CTQ9_PANGU|nr:uncharacterized protein LOC117671320 isoform X1 [Pantherophis guttatus]XP_034283071.1 uncharacterized protein LOC117671320 isoform X1 [Pantherophis guttatus]